MKSGSRQSERERVNWAVAIPCALLYVALIAGMVAVVLAGREL